MNHTQEYGLPSDIPCFLWGRSSGAYLCLLAAAKCDLPRKPAGILSYYGYGFFCDNWFCTPNPYYCSLPAITEDSIRHFFHEDTHVSGDIDSHYALYVYARQTGKWLDLFYKGREKYFYLDYTLRLTNTLPCPVFAVHCTNDPDVPYAEFMEIVNRYHPRQLIISDNRHDFDRDESNPFTAQVLSESLCFLDHPD